MTISTEKRQEISTTIVFAFWHISLLIAECSISHNHSPLSLQLFQLNQPLLLCDMCLADYSNSTQCINQQKCSKHICAYNQNLISWVCVWTLSRSLCRIRFPTLSALYRKYFSIDFIRLTCLTLCSREASSTGTRVWAHQINARSTILTRRTGTYVEVWKQVIVKINSVGASNQARIIPVTFKHSYRQQSSIRFV